jgi:hypothetical protein
VGWPITGNDFKDNRPMAFSISPLEKEDLRMLQYGFKKNQLIVFDTSETTKSQYLQIDPPDQKSNNYHIVATFEGGQKVWDLPASAEKVLRLRQKEYDGVLYFKWNGSAWDFAFIPRPGK